MVSPGAQIRVPEVPSACLSAGRTCRSELEMHSKEVTVVQGCPLGMRCSFYCSPIQDGLGLSLAGFAESMAVDTQPTAVGG